MPRVPPSSVRFTPSNPLRRREALRQSKAAEKKLYEEQRDDLEADVEAFYLEQAKKDEDDYANFILDVRLGYI